jgi:hypothetical protein
MIAAFAKLLKVTDVVIFSTATSNVSVMLVLQTAPFLTMTHAAVMSRL